MLAGRRAAAVTQAELPKLLELLLWLGGEEQLEVPARRTPGVCNGVQAPAETVEEINRSEEDGNSLPGHCWPAPLPYGYTSRVRACVCLAEAVQPHLFSCAMGGRQARCLIARPRRGRQPAVLCERYHSEAQPGAQTGALDECHLDIVLGRERETNVAHCR